MKGSPCTFSLHIRQAADTFVDGDFCLYAGDFLQEVLVVVLNKLQENPTMFCF
jgi:hypothetical protein